MSDVAIRVDHLGKQYRLGQREPYKMLRETIRRAGSAPFRVAASALRRRGQESGVASTDEYIWALNDVSFEVKRGDVLGIIGRNGAGKSTLLKILSRITEPTRGRAEIYGRVGSLLEVGTGFHPELTGRENVYLNGAILGMKRGEIDRKFDEIVAFAEIEKFMDTPVKRYSSGMYVRLAFAVAAHLEPEILVVDEVLAVGDAAFQKKCLGKMGDVATEGRTVLFVSHNMKAVSQLCGRAVLLSGGRVTHEGVTEEVLQAYQRQWMDVIDGGEAKLTFAEDSDKSAQITSVTILDKEGRPTLRHDLLKGLDVVIDFVLRADFPTLLVCAEIRSSDGTVVYGTEDADWVNYTSADKVDHFPRKAGRYRGHMPIPGPLLNANQYHIELYLATGPVRLDTQTSIVFEIVDNGSFVSHVRKSPRGGVVVPAIPWVVEHLADHR